MVTKERSKQQHDYYIRQCEIDPEYRKTRRVKVKIWQDSHKEERKEYSRIRHIERYTQDNKNRAEYTQKIRRQIINLLGGKCVNPYNLNHGDFIDYYMSLCIDHINGGGTKERKKHKSYDQYLNKILNDIQAGSKDYQLLCANCNFIKRYKNKEGITNG